MLSARLSTLLLVAILAPSAYGVEPAPVTIVPTSIRVGLSSPEESATCGAIGTSSASINTTFGPGSTMTGQLQGTASIAGNDLVIDLSGFAAGGPGEIKVQVQWIFEFDVPNLGDATSPTYLVIRQPLETGSGWRIKQIMTTPTAISPATCPGPNLGGLDLPTSTMLGVSLGYFLDSFTANYSNEGPPYLVTNKTTPSVFPAGDRVVVSLVVDVRIELTSALGSFDDTVTLSLLSLTSAMGSGDLDGNGAVNIVDSTILRQRLAGFPE